MQVQRTSLYMPPLNDSRVSQRWCVGRLPLTDSNPLPDIIAVSTCSVFNEGNASCKTDGHHGKNIKLGKWDLLSNDGVRDKKKKKATKKKKNMIA